MQLLLAVADTVVVVFCVLAFVSVKKRKTNSVILRQYSLYEYTQEVKESGKDTNYFTQVILFASTNYFQFKIGVN